MGGTPSKSVNNRIQSANAAVDEHRLRIQSLNAAVDEHCLLEAHHSAYAAALKHIEFAYTEIHKGYHRHQSAQLHDRRQPRPSTNSTSSPPPSLPTISVSLSQPTRVYNKSDTSDEERRSGVACISEYKAVRPTTQQVTVETKIGSSDVSLTQIVHQLHDGILRAYHKVNGVSKILGEIRMHFLAANPGIIDPCASLMPVLAKNRTIKGLQLINGDDYDKSESLASVLHKLQGLETKFYEEVKKHELIRIKYDGKLASIQRQENQGTPSKTLQKTRAEAGHLLKNKKGIIEAMGSTISKIACLRDGDLYKKLVSLADGMGRMWEAVNAQFSAQMKMAEHLRALNELDMPNEIREDHHKFTIQLYKATNDWHQQSSKLLISQQYYITELRNWLVLNLQFESNIKVKNSFPDNIKALFNNWLGGLYSLQDKLCTSKIPNLAAIMESIQIHRQEELAAEMQCKNTEKDLAREIRIYNDLNRKSMERGITSRRSKNTLSKIRVFNENLRSPELYRKYRRHLRESSSKELTIQLCELFKEILDFLFAARSMYEKLVPGTDAR